MKNLTEVVNFKKAAKVLLKKAEGSKPLGYTAYLRAVIQGKPEQATHLRTTKNYAVDAGEAMQDLIDMAGKGKYESLGEAMGTMNVGAYMKVSRGAMARPRTMLDANTWSDDTEEEEGDDENFPTLPRTGVWSRHGVPTLREDTEERAQLEDMGVEFGVSAPARVEEDASQEAGFAMLVEGDVRGVEEGSQSWKKLWGKAKADVKAKGKGPASKSTLARMDRKQSKANAQPYDGDPFEDPRYTAHKARRGKKTKGEDEAPSASILSEKQKLHPSMKKHTNTAKFRAHIGDPDDSEPPYHKGKGIQKKEEEDAPVSAAALREGSAGKKRLRRRVKARVKAHTSGKIGDEELMVDNPKVYAKNVARKARSQKEDAPVGASVLREGLNSDNIRREYVFSTKEKAQAFAKKLASSGARFNGKPRVKKTKGWKTFSAVATFFSLGDTVGIKYEPEKSHYNDIMRDLKK